MSPYDDNWPGVPGPYEGPNSPVNPRERPCVVLPTLMVDDDSRVLEALAAEIRLNDPRTVTEVRALIRNPFTGLDDGSAESVAYYDAQGHCTRNRRRLDSP